MTNLEFTPDLAMKLMYVIMFYIVGCMLAIAITTVLQSELVILFFGLMGVGIIAHCLLWLKTKKEYEKQERSKLN